MSVSDGQPVNAATTNAAFMSRTSDTSTSGKIDLNNAAAASGTAITNAQREHNSIASFVGKSVNQAYNNTPTWASDAIGTANQSIKDRVDSIQSYVSGISSGAGGGLGLNYILNPDFEIGITDWNAYSDAAASEPVDGTSAGTPSNLSIGAGGDDLYGSICLEMTKGASDAQGAGFSYDFTISKADYDGASKSLKISFSYKISGSYVSDDMAVFIYDVTNSELIPVTADNTQGNGGSIIYSDTPAKFTGLFETSSTSDSYRIIFHVATTNASAYSLFVDNVVVGPVDLVPGAVISQRQSFTPSWTNLSIGNGTQEWYYQRIGSKLHVHGYTLFGSTTAISGAVTMANPVSGTTFISETLVYQPKAYFLDDSTAANRAYGLVLPYTTTTLKLVTNQSADLSSTVPFTWATNDILSFDAMFDIAEWQPSAMISTSEVVFMSARAKAYRDSSTQSLPNATDTVLDINAKAFDSLGIIDLSTNMVTVPKTGDYFLSASALVEYASGAPTTEELLIKIEKNTTTSVVQDVRAMNPYGSGGSIVIACHGLVRLEKGDTLRTVLRQDTGGVYNINYGERHTHFEIFYIPDFSTFSVYGQKEIKEASSSAFALSTSGYATTEYAQMTGNSVSLSPGVWKLEGSCYMVQTGGGAASILAVGWFAANGDNTASAPTALSPTPTTRSFTYEYVTSHTDIELTAKTIIFRPTVNTTVYLVPAVTFAVAGSNSVMVDIIAERIS